MIASAIHATSLFLDRNESGSKQAQPATFATSVKLSMIRQCAAKASAFQGICQTRMKSPTKAE
jgi:hypothetical protein